MLSNSSDIFQKQLWSESAMDKRKVIASSLGYSGIIQESQTTGIHSTSAFPEENPDNEIMLPSRLHMKWRKTTLRIETVHAYTEFDSAAVLGLTENVVVSACFRQVSTSELRSPFTAWIEVNMANSSETLGSLYIGSGAVPQTGLHEPSELTTNDEFSEFELYDISDWDGYGADPITASTIATARSFYRMLPRILPPPDIAPGADGTIGFEWRLGSKETYKLFFVDIGPGEYIAGYSEGMDVEAVFDRQPFDQGVQVVLDALNF
jgi:hypothetical protein